MDTSKAHLLVLTTPPLSVGKATREYSERTMETLALCMRWDESTQMEGQKRTT